MTTDAGVEATDKHGSMAAWLLAMRSGLNQSWRSAAVLAALFGVASGIALAALTTADRVESSYEELLVETDAPDAVAYCYECQDEADHEDFTRLLQSDPAIATVAIIEEVYPILYTSDGLLLGPFDSECGTGVGEMSVTSGSWARSDTSPVRLTSGRLPAQNAASEIALPSITANRAGVEVGDQLSVVGVCNVEEGADAGFTPQTLTVVGIFVGFLNVRPPGQAEYYEMAIADESFSSSIGIASNTGGTLVWYAEGSETHDLSDTSAASVFMDMKDHARLIGDRLRPDATALRMLAAFGALAAVAVLGQLLARYLRLLGADHTTLRALGATRRGLWGLGVGHGILIGFAAAAVSVLIAVVFTPLVPPGSGEEILLGTSASTPVTALALGAVTTIAVLVVLSIVPSWLAARAYARTGSRRQTIASRLVGDGRLGTTPSWGVRLALEPSSGSQPVPVRSGLGAAIIATAVVAGVITFAAGLQHLRTTPRLVGWDWDFVAGGDDVDVEALAEFADAHPDVARSSLGTIFPSHLSVGVDTDNEAYDYAFSTGTDAITAVVVSGRAPEGADEVLLNREMAQDLGVELGDSVTVFANDYFAQLHYQLRVISDLSDRRSVEYELVGIGVLPVYGGQFDIGLSLTLDGLERAFAPASHDAMISLLLSADPIRLRQVLAEYGMFDLAAEFSSAPPDQTAEIIQAWSDEQLAPLNPTATPHGVYVDIADNADRAAVVADFAQSGLLEDAIVIGVLPDGTAASSTELVAIDLDDVAWIPAGMGMLMGLTTLAVLAHLIATGARARRRDIATLRALGLVGRQARAIVAWQALTLVVVTAAVALPIGVVAGRYAWRSYAEGLGVAPEPVTPWSLLAVLFAGLVVAHLLASLLPGRAAARMRPVESLRSE